MLSYFLNMLMDENVITTLFIWHLARAVAVPDLCGTPSIILLRGHPTCDTCKPFVNSSESHLTPQCIHDILPSFKQCAPIWQSHRSRPRNRTERVISKEYLLNRIFSKKNLQPGHKNDYTCINYISTLRLIKQAPPEFMAWLNTWWFTQKFTFILAACVQLLHILNSLG